MPLHLWVQNAGPHKFEGSFEAQNVVLVSGLQLGYGWFRLGLGLGLGIHF